MFVFLFLINRSTFIIGLILVKNKNISLGNPFFGFVNFFNKFYLFHFTLFKYAILASQYWIALFKKIFDLHGRTFISFLVDFYNYMNVISNVSHLVF